MKALRRFRGKGEWRVCHPCDVDLEPLDDPQDPVKSFYNEFKSFNKTKTDTVEKKKEEEKARLEEKAKDAILLPETSSSTQSIKQVERSLIKNKQDGEKMYLDVGNKEKIEKMETMIPAKGQANLGNTCFFNSVMQCIMHTHHLDYYFNRFGRVETLTFSEPKTVVLCDEKVELPIAEMPVPNENSPLNDVVKHHLTEFRIGHSPEPRNVFSEVSRKAPRFKGWAQQDAHELLRYLLDGLRSEEQERYKSAIASHYGVSKEKRPKNTDPIVVKGAKAYLKAAGRPLLDAVFGGTLLQTIHCRECDHVSETKEEFLDLSVPISFNPMAASRMSAGQSSHKKKKNAKLAKKMAKKSARKNSQVSSEKNSDVSESEEPSSEELESEATDEDEEKTYLGGKLDLTKVLAAAPSEYQQEKSIGTCLLAFTAQELLTGANSYECEECCLPRNKKTSAKGPAKKRVEAYKRYLIYEPPVVLTLQLKRFQQIHSNGRLSTSKLSGYVEFPVLFDIAPFCCKSVQRVNPGQTEIHYTLYGVVVHSGGLSGGHYIAYVKSRHRVPRALEFLEAARTSCVDAMACSPKLSAKPTCELGNIDGQWYYCSDSHVRPVAEKDVLNSEAYILFYERRH